MTRILAIDPGTTRSAWVLLAGGRPEAFGIVPNDELLAKLRKLGGTWNQFGAGVVVIERVASYGMAVGVEVFETVYWSGRFAEAADPVPVERLTRKAVVIQLCGSPKAKDSNVRQALIDRFGGAEGKAAAIGLKRSPGPLYGMSADAWAALAVAVAWADGAR
jgi:hypothetical protein